MRDVPAELSNATGDGECLLCGVASSDLCAAVTATVDAPPSPVAHSAGCFLLVCGLAHGLGMFRQSTFTEKEPQSLGPQATGSGHAEEFPVLSIKQLCHMVGIPSVFA